MARSPRPIAATRWAGRSPRSGGGEDAPPIGAAAGCHSSPRGCGTPSSAARGGTIHKARRQRSDGSRFAEVEAEVRYALGSGTRGITYLIERDGFLFQSPIAWFAQQRRWDISPGYGEFGARPNFERPILPDCLACHANQFRPVAGTLNRYETPIFQGHAIGCERCHGPGALHVKAPGRIGRVRPDDREPGRPGSRACGNRSVSNATSRARTDSRGRAAGRSTTARASPCTGSRRSS